MKTLVKKDEQEVLAAIEDLNDDQKAELLALENKTETPRPAVLEALTGDEKGGEDEKDDTNGVDPDELAKARALIAEAEGGKHPYDELNTKKPFSMTYFEGGKHYFQDGKVFDRATKKLIKDFNKKS